MLWPNIEDHKEEQSVYIYIFMCVVLQPCTLPSTIISAIWSVADLDNYLQKDFAKNLNQTKQCFGGEENRDNKSKTHFSNLPLPTPPSLSHYSSLLLTPSHLTSDIFFLGL